MIVRHPLESLCPVRAGQITGDPNEGTSKNILIGRSGGLIIKSGIKLSINFNRRSRWLGSLRSSFDSHTLASKPLTIAKNYRTRNMSRRSVAISPEESLNTGADKAPSRDRAYVQSTSRAPIEMMLASRPRTYDL